MAEAEEDRSTLAPMEIHGRSEEEMNAGLGIWPRRTEESSGNCFLYSLTIFVIVFAFCLVLALIFLQISKPEIKLRATVIRNLEFGGNSSNPFFNATFLTDITIDNSNLGDFNFEDSLLRVFYGNQEVVGVTEISGRRIDAHKTTRLTDIVIEISSSGLMMDSRDLDSDLRLGFLKLGFVADIRGRIKVLAKTKWKVAALRCIMTLNLTDRLIQNLSCA